MKKLVKYNWVWKKFSIWKRSDFISNISKLKRNKNEKSKKWISDDKLEFDELKKNKKILKTLN